MNKRVKEIKEEYGQATVNYKDGRKAIIPTKTIYTYYEDGTNDCHVSLEKPIDSGSVPLQPKGMKEGDK